ncbi:class A beta-lactamase [soil metagenome]
MSTLKSKFVLFILFTTSVIAGCNYKLDIPLEYPTPPPTVQSTPVPALTLRTDRELAKQFADIASEIEGEVGAAAVVIETGEAAFLNGDERFPMQSVYKLPIAMAVLEQVNRGRLDLDEKIGVAKDDMVRKGMRSPLRDGNPEGGEFTIRELIRLAMVESDGTASDVLMRVAGDAGEVQSFITRTGIFEMKVEDLEKEIGRDWQTQYRNYATPAAAVELLRWLRVSADAEQPDSREPIETPWGLLLQFMADSNPGAARLKGLLPKGTVVAHKTGTSGTQNRITAATNDIGIITLANGKHAAVAVFVSDSTADEKAREAIIARIAHATWDRFSK